MDHSSHSLSSSSLKANPLRTYQGIWLKLRSEQRVVIELVDKVFYTRVKKMIIKEKCLDEGFKLINEVEKFRLSFSWNEEKKEMTVVLASKFGVTDLVG